MNIHYINKLAFDKGFRAFQKGNYFDNPFDKDTDAWKEWQRGQNEAYAMYLNRNLTRERYKNAL